MQAHGTSSMTDPILQKKSIVSEHLLYELN